jgi:hypothetical protein
MGSLCRQGRSTPTQWGGVEIGSRVMTSRPLGNSVSATGVHQPFRRSGASQMFMVGGASSLR